MPRNSRQIRKYGLPPCQNPKKLAICTPQPTFSSDILVKTRQKISRNKFYFELFRWTKNIRGLVKQNKNIFNFIPDVRWGCHFLILASSHRLSGLPRLIILPPKSCPKRKKTGFPPQNRPELILRRPCPPGALLINVFFGLPSDKNDILPREFKAVSYTHLTLPTICSV